MDEEIVPHDVKGAQVGNTHHKQKGGGIFLLGAATKEEAREGPTYGNVRSVLVPHSHHVFDEHYQIPGKMRLAISLRLS